MAHSIGVASFSMTGLASIYLPKAGRAKELGIENVRGLLTGNEDGIFADNEAGASEASSCFASGV